MAQVLLIKIANTVDKTVGDVVAILEDTHKFTQDEIDHFEIMKVEGYTRQQLVDYFKGKKPQIERIYKSKTVDAWTLERPEKKDAYKHTDERWYLYDQIVKYPITARNMTSEQKEILADKESPAMSKVIVLDLFESAIRMVAGNLTEVTELNR